MATSKDPLARWRQFCRGQWKEQEKRGTEEKRWEDNIKEWTGMGFWDSLRAAEDRDGWKGIVATSSVMPRRPPRLRDWEMRERKIRLDQPIKEVKIISKAQNSEKMIKKRKWWTIQDNRYILGFRIIHISGWKFRQKHIQRVYWFNNSMSKY